MTATPKKLRGGAMQDAGSAILSPDGVYRYVLTRSWLGGEGTALWVMLNPSTADDKSDDPTIRRIVGFSKDWGFTQATVVNLFAFRATFHGELRTAVDPVGPFNNGTIQFEAQRAKKIICGWGTFPELRAERTTLRNRDLRVLELLSGFKLSALKLTKDGFPYHPLYLPKNTAPVSFP